MGGLIMSQTGELVSALKTVLRAKKITYVAVADHLALSEVTIKRLFSGQSFSLQRFEQICQFAGVSIAELVQQIDDKRGKPLSSLSRDQEQRICADADLLLVTVCVLNRWTLEQLLATYSIEESQVIRYLASLDRLGLIELLPGNKIRLMTTADFRWLENGPIQQFFQEHIADEFFNSRFDKSSEKLLVSNAMLTTASQHLFHRRMEVLLREMEELNRADSQRDFGERQGVTLVLSMRQWRPSLFQQRLRKPV